MGTILTLFDSIAEPARLALIGSGLVVGAVLLRKLLLPGNSPVLDTAAGPTVVEPSKELAGLRNLAAHQAPLADLTK